MGVAKLLKECVWYAALFFLGLAALLAVFFVPYYGYQYFAPKYEAVRRETVEQSKSFHDGAIRNLRDYQIRYLAARDPGERDAIRAAVFSELNSVSIDTLPSDLVAFVDQLRNS